MQLFNSRQKPSSAHNHANLFILLFILIVIYFQNTVHPVYRLLLWILPQRGKHVCL